MPAINYNFYVIIMLSKVQFILTSSMILDYVQNKIYLNLSTINPVVKTLIIPDIHNDYLTAEKIIKKENPVKIIFLGDYFDDFNDTVQDAIHTAKWLKKSLKQNNRIHLIGNHDLNYMTDNPNLKCMGYRTDKHKVIKRQNVDWNKLLMYYWIDEKWLCTHAGFSNDFFKQQRKKKSDSVQQVLDLSKKNLNKMNDEYFIHSFFQVGFSRGGLNDVGGPLWCDYDEFEDIPGINQIFGHTPNYTVRYRKTKNSEHYCIDTKLKHYAVYQEGTMYVKDQTR